MPPSPLTTAPLPRHSSPSVMPKSPQLYQLGHAGSETPSPPQQHSAQKQICVETACSPCVYQDGPDNTPISCCMITQWPLEIKSRIEANTTYQTALLESSPYPLCFFSFDGARLASIYAPCDDSGGVPATCYGLTSSTPPPPSFFWLSNSQPLLARRPTDHMQPRGGGNVWQDDLAPVRHLWDG